MTFEPETLPQLQAISVKLMSPDEGQKMIEEQGGRMGVGNDYASDFLEVSPQSLKTKRTFVIGMKVDSSITSKIQFYRSSDALDLKTWYKVDSSISNGFATLEADEGKITFLYNVEGFPYFDTHLH